MCNNAVPLDLEGTILFPRIPERPFVTQYLSEKHIENEFIESHLFECLQDFMEAL